MLATELQMVTGNLETLLLMPMVNPGNLKTLLLLNSLATVLLKNLLSNNNATQDNHLSIIVEKENSLFSKRALHVCFYLDDTSND